MTFDDVRKISLAWPEVEDGTSYGTPALKVRKKLLVRLKEDGDSLVMFGVPPDERDMLVESKPKVFYFTDHYRDYPVVLIRLSKTTRATVEPLTVSMNIPESNHISSDSGIPLHGYKPEAIFRPTARKDSSFGSNQAQTSA